MRSACRPGSLCDSPPASSASETQLVQHEPAAMETRTHRLAKKLARRLGPVHTASEALLPLTEPGERGGGGEGAAGEGGAEEGGGHGELCAASLWSVIKLRDLVN